MRSTQNIQQLRFGDYYLTSHLGRGGMADVYKARYVGAAGFQRTVVIKRILNAADPECIGMFINEAKLAAELTHPNIAQIYELGEINGEFFIAMEYVRGKDLRHVLNSLLGRKAPLPPLAAAFIAREICRALGHAHAHVDEDGAPNPIMHRDVSPANVVISYDGQVKLVDFGVAKALHPNPDKPQTQAGILKGKLGYLAPEQLEGITVPQSDIFATGIVLYEMLTLRRLFRGDNPFDALALLKSMAFQAPSKVASGIPLALDTIVMKALARDLDHRYPSAAAMAKDLDQLVQSSGFSVDDLALFMSDIYPVEAQTDPAQSMSSKSARLGTQVSARLLGTQPTRSSMSRSMRLAAPADSVSISITAPRSLVTRRSVLGTAAVGLLAVGGYGAFWFDQRSESAAATAAPMTSAAPAAAPALTPDLPGAAAAVPAGGVRGVTDTEIVFGMAAAVSGPAKEYGRQMKVGIEAAFASINDRGGVHGRKLRLVVADDSYEPAKTVPAMQELYERHRVFGVIGNTGTPTAAVAVPFALERKMLFFGPYTGASLLRRDPPDRYVFNFRASYGEETAAIVKYLVRVRHIRPEHIAVFAQEDAFGEAGYAGIAKAMRAHRPDVKSIFRVGYQRNSIDVSNAVAQVKARPVRTRAVILLALYRPAAKFIEGLREQYPDTIFISGSWVDSTALAEELKMLGPKFADGVAVTQVVPSPESSSTAILEYKATMARYMPADRVDAISLEGYLAANVLIEGLRRAGKALDTERVVEALEEIRDLDLGIGAPISFGSSEHQGSHRVWGIRLDATGQYQPMDLD